MTAKSLLLLAGDGIGPEVMEQVKRVITWFNAQGKVSFTRRGRPGRRLRL